MQFTNKIVLITGGATGIGAASAVKFASQGAHVYVLDIQVLSYKVENISFLKCDVSDYKAVETAVSLVVEKEGRIDVLVANAAIHKIATIEDSDLALIDELINVNIKGVVYTLKAVLPIMRDQYQGSVAIMGSTQCFTGKSDNAIYGLTKGAIGQLTKSTALEYAPYKVRINCVCPGTTNTPIVRSAMVELAKKSNVSIDAMSKIFASEQPLERIATPEEIANIILFVCSDEASFMTGSLVPVDGGSTAQ